MIVVLRCTALHTKIRPMTTSEAVAEPLNSHIAVSSYEVTVGSAVVTMKRYGSVWILESPTVDREAMLRLPDTADALEFMTKTAVEYARRIDVGIQIRRKLEAHEDATRRWVNSQAYESAANA